MPKKSHKKKSQGVSMFDATVGLGLILASYWFVLFGFQDTISGVPLLNFLITLGGIETYADTVIGTGILFFIFGFWLVLRNN